MTKSIIANRYQRTLLKYNVTDPVYLKKDMGSLTSFTDVFLLKPHNIALGRQGVG